ncbi:hypothetical protein FPJ27_15395 [Burkholderia sp. MS455]|uniref:hypothetical protein n=1 Tax=Burkholderia sp. MS455 TaxID=2811788 RepID=UPI00195A3310|nr:hypothetical protein [Burkholderia sp. MS455]QRR07649.1 hypothetical protein FPJ27_15395 [Burkholderia sp. MS455]
MEIEEKVSLSELKKNFDAWHVPSEQDFAHLIDVAAVSFQPGDGLAGGDPSKRADEVAAPITPLVVKAAELGGLSATATGVAVNINGGGLKLNGNDQVYVDVSDKSMTTVKGVAVQAVKPLRVGTEVSLDIDENHGLKWSDYNVGLNVDGKTVAFDPKQGFVFVQCAKNKGLKIDANGNLTVDLDHILNPT